MEKQLADEGEARRGALRWSGAGRARKRRRKKEGASEREEGKGIKRSLIARHKRQKEERRKEIVC